MPFLALLALFTFAAVITVEATTECPTKTMKSKVREALLARHNELRSRIANGKEKTSGGRFAPKAKNMYKLVYDCDIEKNAQKWANGCLFEHSPANVRDAGENLFISVGGSTDLETIGLSACDSWWSELNSTGIVNKDYILTEEVFATGVGHFTQMAWGKTTRLGCGIADKCSHDKTRSVLVVCQYRDIGNVFNRPIYEIGNPCAANSECTTFPNSTCSVKEGLCEKPNK